MWVSQFLQLLARLLVGAYPRWIGSRPNYNQRIYIANHTSHIDIVAIWAALPTHLQKHTHSVAAWDYWANSKFKRWLTTNGLNAVYIKRNRDNNNGEDPLLPLYETLEKGESLILFPKARAIRAKSHNRSNPVFIIWPNVSLMWSLSPCIWKT